MCEDDYEYESDWLQELENRERAEELASVIQQLKPGVPGFGGSVANTTEKE